MAVGRITSEQLANALGWDSRTQKYITLEELLTRIFEEEYAKPGVQDEIRQIFGCEK